MAIGILEGIKEIETECNFFCNIIVIRSQDLNTYVYYMKCARGTLYSPVACGKQQLTMSQHCPSETFATFNNNGGLQACGRDSDSHATQTVIKFSSAKVHGK